jgi:hypothetical protein
MMTMNETTVISPLAAEILDLHRGAVAKVESAKGGISEAIEASRHCAALVDTARAEWGSQFKAIWRDQIQLPDETASRYLTLHKNSGRRIDKAQLLLLGIVEGSDDPPAHYARPTDPFAWSKHVAKIREGLNADSIEAMTPEQIEVTRATLKPLVELYQKLP